MIGFIRKLLKDRRGNVLAIACAAMPLIIGCAGLATDTIEWTLWKRQLQRAPAHQLLGQLEAVPLARHLLVGAAVYRLPVDDVGLGWQVGDEQPFPADPHGGPRHRP